MESACGQHGNAGNQCKLDKQQEKFIVVYLNGLTYGTSAAERAADIDYVNKVYAAASGT